MKKIKTNADDDISTAAIGFISDGLLCEILSRLPAKTLMRFKSVSKHWQSIIQYNPHFFHLHYAISQTRPSLLMRCRPEHSANSTVFYSVDDYLKGDGAAEALHKVTVPWPNHMLNPVNGLICFIDINSVLIYNPSTREQTPWIETSIEKIESGIKNGVEFVRSYRPYYGFGFDPATKEHKVVCIWHIFTYRGRRRLFLRLAESVELVCEVLSVGHNSWRKIDVVPPYELDDFSACWIGFYPKFSVYVNGSIYWLTASGGSKFLVAFDVGSEKFRAIYVPSLIHDVSISKDHNDFDLLGVDGSVALMERVYGWFDIKTVNILKFDDHDKEKNTTTGTVSDTNGWNVETVYWKREQTNVNDGNSFVHKYYCSVEVIAGEVVIVRRQGLTEFSIYYYNRKEKNYRKKLDISTDQIPINDNIDCVILHTTPFAESLFPVKK